jgi:hypothetical protein
MNELEAKECLSYLVTREKRDRTGDGAGVEDSKEIEEISINKGKRNDPACFRSRIV